MLTIKPINDYPSGTLEKLLVSAYSAFHREYPEYSEENYKKFHECDSFFYENLEIGLNCSFVTEYHGNLCGMCCWDPRKFPEAVIGHNCILPEFRGIGLGKEQLQTAVNLLFERGFTVISVSTGTLDFFIPAQQMYRSAGFTELRRDNAEEAVNKLHANVYYELLKTTDVPLRKK
jgi:Acetyltransferase (GNAT) family.